MKDLIERQAAIDAIIAKLDSIDHVPQWVFDEFTGVIDNLPSVQPEIIRCRDCKFYTPLNRETKSGICSLLIHQNFGDDWYCAGAERRICEPD